jgi:hypothetical protein
MRVRSRAVLPWERRRQVGSERPEDSDDIRIVDNELPFGSGIPTSLDGLAMIIIVKFCQVHVGAATFEDQGDAEFDVCNDDDGLRIRAAVVSRLVLRRFDGICKVDRPSEQPARSRKHPSRLQDRVGGAIAGRMIQSLPSKEFLLCHLNNDVFRTTSSRPDSMYRMSNVTGRISV